MKKLRSKLFLASLITALTLNTSYGVDPSYKLSVENLNKTSASTLEFDIYLLHTNPEESKFSYVLGQYFLNFNSEIGNGGNLTFEIIGSDLPQGSIPGNPSIDGNILRMAVNPVPSMENLPVVSSTAPGTLIVKARLSTSAKAFAEVPLNLSLRTGPENPFTKVTTYEDGKIKDITVVSESSVVDNPMGTSNKISSALPTVYALSQNFPNPFNPSTNINFDIPDLSNVRLSIFDITGREISVLVNENLEPGSYSYKWNGADFASGMYFYRVQAGDFVQTRKMVLIK